MALSPSNLKLLLGLAAVAGWQNRDKISDFVKGLSPGGAQAAQIPGGIGGALGGLVSHFQNNGAAPEMNSWVGTGQNLPLDNSKLSQVLGPDLINQISRATGLPADQLVNQLGAVLPQIVDRLTPNGRLPG